MAAFSVSGPKRPLILPGSRPDLASRGSGIASLNAEPTIFSFAFGANQPSPNVDESFCQLGPLQALMRSIYRVIAPLLRSDIREEHGVLLGKPTRVDN
jgi:hypothetical protein